MVQEGGRGETDACVGERIDAHPAVSWAWNVNMRERIITESQASHSGLCFCDTVTSSLSPWQQTCARLCLCVWEKRPRVWHAGICFLLEKVNYISTGWLDVPCIITHANETCACEGGPLSATFMCIHNTTPCSRSKDISATCFSFQGPLLRKKGMHVRAEVGTRTGDSWECTAYEDSSWNLSS